MGWMDKVKMISGTIANKAIDFTASTLNVCGSTACLIGGMGFAATQSLSGTINATYFGNANAVGKLDVDGQLEDSKLGVNYTLPLHVNGTKQGHIPYKLADYLDPNTMYFASAVLVGSGTILCALGNSLKKWQEQHYDESHYETLYNTRPIKPTAKEYLAVNAKSLSYSLSLSLLSYHVVSCVINYSSLLSKLHITYPFTGERVTGTDYHGPIARGAIPVNINLDPERIPIQIPIIGEIDVLLNMLVNGTVAVTYGGGLFFKSEVSGVVPSALKVASSAIGGLSAYIAGGFFSRKERQQRDERVSHLGQHHGSLQTTDEEAFFRLTY